MLAILLLITLGTAISWALYPGLYLELAHGISSCITEALICGAMVFVMRHKLREPYIWVMLAFRMR